METFSRIKDQNSDIEFANINYWLINAYHLNREITLEELKNEINDDILKGIGNICNSKFKSYDIEKYYLSEDPLFGTDINSSFLRFPPLNIKICNINAKLYIRINPCSIKCSKKSDPKIIIIIDQKYNFHQKYTLSFFKEAKIISNKVSDFLKIIFDKLDENCLLFYRVSIHSVGCEFQIANTLINSSKNKDEYLRLLKSNQEARKLNNCMNQWGEPSFEFCHSGWAVWKIRDNEKEINSIGVIGMCTKQEIRKTNLITLSNGNMEQTHSFNRAIAIPIIRELRLRV